MQGEVYIFTKLTIQEGEIEVIGLDDDSNVIWRAGSRGVITDFKILEDRIIYHDDEGYDYVIGTDGSKIE